MTREPPLPPALSRTGSQRRLVVLGDERRGHDDPGCFGPADEPGRRPRPGRTDTKDRAAQLGIDCVVAGWDDLGPEAA